MKHRQNGVISRGLVLGAMQLMTDKGTIPTIRGIAKLTGLRSTSTIVHHLRALERGGHVERVKSDIKQRRHVAYVVAGRACPTCARPFEAAS